MMRDFNPWDIKRPFSSTDKRPGRYVTGAVSVAVAVGLEVGVVELTFTSVGFIIGPAVGVPVDAVGLDVDAVGLDVGVIALTSTPGVP
jgi:hypothetical protein